MASQVDKFISSLFYGRDDLEDAEDTPQQKMMRLFVSGDPHYAKQGVTLAEAMDWNPKSTNLDWAYPIYRAFVEVAQSVPKLVRAGYPHEERDVDTDYNDRGGRSARSQYNDPRISLMVAFHGMTKDTYPQWWIDPNTIPHRTWPPYKFLFDEERIFDSHGLPLMVGGPNYVAGWDRLDELARDSRFGGSSWVVSPDVEVTAKARGLSVDPESALYGEVRKMYDGRVIFDTEYTEAPAYGPIEPQERILYLTDRSFYTIKPKKYLEGKWNSSEAQEAFMEANPRDEEGMGWLYEEDGELIWNWKDYAHDSWVERMEEIWEEDFNSSSLYNNTANIDFDVTCHTCLPQNAWFAMLPANWDDGYISSMGTHLPFPFTGAEVLTFTFLTAAFMRIFADVPPDKRKELQITDPQLIGNLMPFVLGMNVKPDDPSGRYPGSFSTKNYSHLDGLAKSVEEWLLPDLMSPWGDEWIENIDFDITGFSDFTLP